MLKVIFKGLLPVLTPEMAKQLTDAASLYYNPGLYYLFCFELGYNTLMVFAFVYLIVIFFRKQKEFPKAFIIIFLINLFVIGIETVAPQLMTHTVNAYNAEINYRGIIKQVIVCAVWIPYMIMSKRVKETFVK